MKENAAIIQEHINKIADFSIKTFSTFRLWSENARAYFPSWEPEVENEALLIEDMVEHIQKSIFALFKKENDLKRKNIPGWS